MFTVFLDALGGRGADRGLFARGQAAASLVLAFHKERGGGRVMDKQIVAEWDCARIPERTWADSFSIGA